VTDASPLIVLAAGGTGGHVFPAEALARELLGRGLRVALLTDKRGGKFGDDLPVPAYRVRSSSLGKTLLGKARSVIEMGIGVWQARSRLHKLAPAVVVGFGGYPSIPALYAAAQMGIPILLHEQNAVLGRANRAMMNKAELIATSFPHVTGLKPSSNVRLVQTGKPAIRSGLPSQLCELRLMCRLAKTGPCAFLFWAAASAQKFSVLWYRKLLPCCPITCVAAW
jgi:UDP-N-acetylglucosamine--N-acetylmuramyl-(pentapeptide) pyrophosphoryl-undecaprenol N-acetylglucosamine transferase